MSEGDEGTFERNARLLAEAAELTRQGRLDLAAQCHLLRGLELERSGDYPAAWEALEATAPEGHTATGRRAAAGRGRLLLAGAGDDDERARLERAVEEFVLARDAAGAALAWRALGQLHTRTGNVEAASLCGQAAQRASAMEGTNGHLQPFPTDEAGLRLALDHARRGGDLRAHAKIALSLAVQLCHDGARADAGRFGAEGLDLVEEMPRGALDAEVLLDAADALEALAPDIAAGLRQRAEAE